jgi:LacI family transcriptional regulator
MRPGKRVTLKDIAVQTGYTINTISRALKDKHDISLNTRMRIQETAARLGYIGDSAASSLRSGKTKTIAVIIGDISNPFFGSQVRDIELVARENGYTVIIYNTGEHSDWEHKAILSAYGRRVDGIIICPVQENKDNILLIQHLGIPFVLIGRYFKDIPCDAVLWDDVAAGELATSYLIGLGHVNILYVGGPLYISSGNDRLQGYRNAHIKGKIPVNEQLIRITNITAGASGEAILQVLEEGLPFTAIVAFSDLMACEILYTLEKKEKGARVYVSIVGCDDIREKILFPVSFPSIRCTGDEARICMDLLIQKMHNRSHPAGQASSRQNKPRVCLLDVELREP